MTASPDPSQTPSTDPESDAVHTPESVFAALVAGETELSSEQLAVLSDIDAARASGFISSLSELEAPARFALLDALVEAEATSNLLDFSALHRAALRDEDPGVRALVVAGLATCEAPEIIPHLLEAAQSDPDETVRSEAAIALGGFALRAELGQLRPQLAEQVVAGLRNIATDNSEDPAVQAAAIASLGAVDQAWVPDLIYDAYESADPALRIGALQAMGRTADEYWLPSLVNAMDSPESDERYAAARAAGEMASEDAIVPLGELLDDESLDVVEAAATALGEIGGEGAEDRLQPYASHPDSSVREAVQIGIQAARFADDPLGLAGVAGPFAPPTDPAAEASDG